MRRLLLALPLVLAMAACGSDDDAAVTTGAEDTGVPTTPAGSPTTPAGTDAAPTTTRAPLTATPITPVTTGPQGPAGPATPAGSDEETAIADLAAREGVDPAAITTVSVENVTWRNSSIGCPEPGMNYMQSLVDGVRVVLELDGTRFEYHAGGSLPLFYCATPEPPVGE